MKIGMITPWKVKCGIFTYTENLAKALAELGADVYIVRLPRFGAKTAEILQNVVDSIPVERVDLIHVQEEYGLYQNLEGGFYAGLKALKKPLVTTLHAIGNWDIDRVICTTSGRVIVHNEFCARRLGYPSVIIPHGCSPQQTVPIEEAKKALGIDPKIPIVGYCGFLSTYKNLETLIEAAEKLPSIALLIGGGWHAGPDTEYIMALKQRTNQTLQGRCQWLGWVPDERLPTVYGAMDIVAYPSRFATESGALLMALSHGKAVIASNLSPFKEKEKVGALTTFRDVQDLIRKIKRLLKDEEMRTRLEHGAWDYAQNTRWEKVAATHISLYESLLKEVKS